MRLNQFKDGRYSLVISFHEDVSMVTQWELETA